ncbi:MAG: hypothetical protein Q8L97_10175 [Nitrosomonas sp.]|uniref:hypothetical protein n=1 Tax=Nitrosomonas sp. TaxID=42353 RepID=UPI002731D0BD|nr:hypothetical protein [Nitrosomonas sp.]MDP1550509.1 hypothetical protein [Nitrosomonas sp.]
MSPFSGLNPNFLDPKDDTNSFWLVAHADDIERAECDPEAAAKLLLFAAEYLENGEVVPKPLAEFIAHAFKRAASVEKGKRKAELALYLCLTAPHTRPKPSENELGLWVFRQLYDSLIQGSPKTETAVLNAAARHFSSSKTAATRKWKAWQRRKKDFVAVLDRLRS